MSQQTSPARLVRLDSVNEDLAGQKLRLVGRLLSYDSTTGLVLLVDGDRALLVDVSFCVVGDWVRERLGKVMVVGHLEGVAEELAIPTLPTFSPAPVVNPTLVVRAVLVEESEDLDLDLWDAEIERRRGDLLGDPKSGTLS